MNDPNLSIETFASDFKSLLQEDGWTYQQINQKFPQESLIRGLSRGNKQTIKTVYTALNNLNPTLQQEQTICKNWLKEIVTGSQEQRTEKNEKIQNQEHQKSREPDFTPLTHLRPKQKSQSRQTPSGSTPK